MVCNTTGKVSLFAFSSCWLSLPFLCLKKALISLVTAGQLTADVFRKEEFFTIKTQIISAPNYAWNLPKSHLTTN